MPKMTEEQASQLSNDPGVKRMLMSIAGLEQERDTAVVEKTQIASDYATLKANSDTEIAALRAQVAALEKELGSAKNAASYYLSRLSEHRVHLENAAAAIENARTAVAAVQPRERPPQTPIVDGRPRQVGLRAVAGELERGA